MNSITNEKFNVAFTDLISNIIIHKVYSTRLALTKILNWRLKRYVIRATAVPGFRKKQQAAHYLVKANFNSFFIMREYSYLYQGGRIKIIVQLTFENNSTCYNYVQ